MQMTPYLNFPGTCAEAFHFYAALFGGKIDTEMTHGAMPAPNGVPADWKDKIMHIRMSGPDGMALMGSDAPPAYHKTPQGFAVSLQLRDPAEAERIYAALADRGEVRMALQQTFWAERFAMLSDRFGIPWIINCAPDA